MKRLVAAAAWALLACSRQPANTLRTHAPVPAPPAPVVASNTKGKPAPILVVTAADRAFAPSTPVTSVAGGSVPDVVVEPKKAQQTMEGFGGAFNEHGWSALLALEPAEREAVLKSIFDSKAGLRFNLARTPVGASDY